MIGAGTGAHVATGGEGVSCPGTRSTRIERVEGDDPLDVYRSFAEITRGTRVSEGR